MEKRSERSIFAMANVETREVGDGEHHVISGHAAVFNALSEDLGGFREQIAPGTFQRSIEESDVAALWSHIPHMPLGRTGNKSLSLHEDSEGLYFELELPNTSIGRDAWEYIRNGTVRWMSFGFFTRDDKWEQRKEGYVRTLLDVELQEVSPVMFPAYPQTDVGARSKVARFEEEVKLAEDRAAVKEIARFLSERERELRLRAKKSVYRLR